MKSVTHIDCPKEWEITNDWDSHRPIIYLSLTKTKGQVVEFGSGFGSTILLRKFCKENKRLFISYETNKDWANKTKSIFIQAYFNPSDVTSLLSVYRETSLLFIDCAPGEIRKELLQEFKNNSDVLVSHDTECGAEYVYGMKDILSTFKYRLDFKPEGMPQTTAVSNFINLEDWV